MNTEPDLKKWADNLVLMIHCSAMSSRELAELMLDNLEEIADKYYQMGYADGDKTGWWQHYEAYEKEFNVCPRNVETKTTYSVSNWESL